MLSKENENKAIKCFDLKNKIKKVCMAYSINFEHYERNDIIMDSLMISVVETSRLFGIKTEEEFMEFVEQFIEKMIPYNKILMEHEKSELDEGL